MCSIGGGDMEMTTVRRGIWLIQGQVPASTILTRMFSLLITCRQYTCSFLKVYKKYSLLSPYHTHKNSNFKEKAI